MKNKEPFNEIKETEYDREVEEIKEGQSEDITEDIRLIKQASTTEFWKKVFIPYLDHTMAYLDTQMMNEDPWVRYGKVEAYRAMKIFKLYFINSLEQLK